MKFSELKLDEEEREKIKFIVNLFNATKIVTDKHEMKIIRKNA